MFFGKLPAFRTVLLGALLFLFIPRIAMGRLATDCGASRVVSVDSESGKIISSWAANGMGVAAAPFLVSGDGKTVYVGFQTCKDAKGNLVRSGMLEEYPEGMLAPSAATLSVPELRPVANRQPDPSWKGELRLVASSDDDALTWFNKMLFFDKSDGEAKLKLIDLQLLRCEPCS